MKNDLLLPIEKLEQTRLKLKEALRLIQSSDPEHLVKAQIFNNVTDRSKQVHLSTTIMEEAVMRELVNTNEAIRLLRSTYKPAHWFVDIEIKWKDLIEHRSKIPEGKLDQLTQWILRLGKVTFRTRKEAREYVKHNYKYLNTRLTLEFFIPSSCYLIKIRKME